MDEASAAIGPVRLPVAGEADQVLSRIGRRAGGGEPINQDALKYLNRLSDHLFVMGR